MWNDPVYCHICSAHLCRAHKYWLLVAIRGKIKKSIPKEHLGVHFNSSSWQGEYDVSLHGQPSSHYYQSGVDRAYSVSGSFTFFWGIIISHIVKSAWKQNLGCIFEPMVLHHFQQTTVFWNIFSCTIRMFIFESHILLQDWREILIAVSGTFNHENSITVASTSSNSSRLIKVWMWNLNTTFRNFFVSGSRL